MGESDKLQQAIKYSRQKELLWVFSTLAGIFINILAILLGLPVLLWRALDGKVPSRLRLPAFVTILSTLDWLISLPIAFYSGYILEWRYNLSTQRLRHWLLDQLKVHGLSVAFGVPLITSFYQVVRRWPHRWWLIVSAAMLPFTALLSELFPVLIAPLFNKYEPIKDPDLESELRQLASREGVEISRVMRMDMSRRTKKSNAFFTGLGRNRRIVLADTLLDQFSKDEIEAVVAHELGHQVRRDTWKMVGISGLATTISMFLLSRIFPVSTRLLPSKYRDKELSSPANMPLLGLLLQLITLVEMPLVNAYSRRVEYAADEYAVRVTRKPEALVSALQRLQKSNLVDPDPPLITKVLLHSHPSIKDRVNRIRAIAQQQ